MRLYGLVLLALVIWGAPALAELQQVEVGGEIRVRFRGNLNYANGPRGTGPGGSIARYSLSSALGRPIGAAGLQSRYRFDDHGYDRVYSEMRTRLHVKASFTDNISSLVELDSTDVWGEDFRSNYITGADGRGGADLALFQAYIEAGEMFGYPIRLRVGRQALKFGKGWLVGDLISGVNGQSFDAVRLTYNDNDFEIDAWWSKLAERSPLEQDPDVDFYGIYGTYSGIEHLGISAYWMYIRDALSINDTPPNIILDWFENLFDVDDYGVTKLHTVGIRLFGEVNAIDYDLELAYQFGYAGQQGAWFKNVGQVYGDDDAKFGNWATDLEAGYTFDCAWQPRVYLGGAYYQGEDNRDTNFFDWLNPFDNIYPDASISFNRLFANSDAKYSFILDGGQVLSNFIDLRAGVEVQPTEDLELGLEVERFWTDKAFDTPLDFRVGRTRFALPIFSFLTEEADIDLGVQTTIWGKYYFTEDLWVRFRWEHLFPGEGVYDGNFVDRYGLFYMAGTDDDDADYIEVMLGLKF